MKCDKCGYNNSEYDIICENCGFPLSIEKNIELQKKYNHKQQAIDIDEITPDNSHYEFQNTKKKVKISLIIICVVLIFLLSLFAITIIKDMNNKDLLNQFNEIYKSEKISVIYIGKESAIDNNLSTQSEEYNYNYLYINTEKITRNKRNKIKSKLKIDKLNSNVVIVQNEEVLRNIENCTSKNIDELHDSLYEYDLVPKKIGNSSKQIANFDTSIKSENPKIIYYTTIDNKSSKEKNEKLKNFALDYSIDYIFIEGYYLTNSQQRVLLNKINYNTLVDELLIIVDGTEVLTSISSVPNNSKDYFEISSNYGILDTNSAESLKKVNYSQLKKMIATNNKNVILFITDDCMYCDRVKPIVGKISIQKNINIYYYKYKEENILKLEEYLSKIGYEDKKITPPLLIVTESDKILDYVIGLADKKIYEDKFKELGVVR